MTMTSRRRHARVVLSLAYFSGSLAFPTAPATRAKLLPPRATAHNTNLPHHGSRPRRHGESSVPLSLAAARPDEGNAEWNLDDEDESNTLSTRIEDENDAGDRDDVRHYFATCIPGLHDALAAELAALGADGVETQGKSGVRFAGPPSIGMAAVLWCRTAHKIMERLAASDDPRDDEYDFAGGLRGRDDLYKFVRAAVHPPTVLGDGRGGLLTLAVGTVYAGRAPRELCHSHYTALTVKNALVDAVRDAREGGDRPSVDVADADVPLVAVVRGRRASEGRDRDRGGRWQRDDAYEEEDLVADVDLYRCLHAGGSLHRRGYRQADSGWEDAESADGEDRTRRSQQQGGTAPIHKAAMKESLAAGLLLEAGWDKLVNAARIDGLGAVLIDPMTGSGTLPVEAALIACDVAPGLSRIAAWRDNGRGSFNPHRRPPCTRWKDFGDAATWDELLATATRRAKAGTTWARSAAKSGENNVTILCREQNPGAARLARTCVRNADVTALVAVSEGDCGDWDLGGEEPAEERAVVEGRTMFVCNPPWGLRLTADVDDSWVALREFLRREARGCEAWVLSGNKDLTKILRMKKSRTVVAQTADEDLRWLQYHIFRKKGAAAADGVRLPPR